MMLVLEKITIDGTWSKLLSIDICGKRRSRRVERMGKNSVASDKAD